MKGAHIEYTFAISGYDTARLLSQVSRALETRTQILSRQKYPGMWKMTDGLNRSAGARQGNVYLITFAGRVVLLQKKDLQQGAEEFRAFIAEHTAITKSI